MPYTAFNPSAAAAVLDDLLNPSNSLRDVSALHKTSVSALSLWIASPEVQAQLLQQGSAAASITRVLAANHTQEALASIVTANRESAALLNATPRPTPPADTGPETSSSKVRMPDANASDNPISPRSLREYYFQLEFRRRLVESLRKNSNLIFRLTRFQFFEPGAITAPEPAPRTKTRPRPQSAPVSPDTRAWSRVPDVSSPAPSPTATTALNLAPSPSPQVTVSPSHVSTAPNTFSVPPLLPIDLVNRPQHAAIAPANDQLVPPPSPSLRFTASPSQDAPSHAIPRPRAPASLLAAAGRPP